MSHRPRIFYDNPFAKTASSVVTVVMMSFLFVVMMTNRTANATTTSAFVASCMHPARRSHRSSPSSSSLRVSSSGSVGGNTNNGSTGGSSWGSSRPTNSGGAAGGGSTAKSGGIPSKTAIESAVNVEWEPMTELERRIEDGVYYEHLPLTSEQHHRYDKRTIPRSKFAGTTNTGMIDDLVDDDDINVNVARGVFCGYRFTKDDYNRLKSAHP